MKENEITSIGAILLFGFFKINKLKLKQIDISYNILDDNCIKSLGEYIHDNVFIERIMIGNSKVTDEGIKILSHYFDGNVKLKWFDISGNEQITDKSITSLEKIIESSCIERLNIKDTGIKQKGIINIYLINNMLKQGWNKLDARLK